METMFREASYELMNYPNRNIKYRIKNLLKKILKRGYMPKDYINWPNGLLALGILQYALKNNDNEAWECLRNYFDRWIDKGARLYFIDDALSGEVLIALYEKTGDEKYRPYIDSIYDYIKKTIKDEEGTLVYRPSLNNKHILADMLGMVCPFLCSYGQRFGVLEASELAYLQIDNFLKNALDSESGLPYHGYDKSKGLSYGIIGWGRAVGWIMMGMSGLLYYCSEDGLPLSKVNDIREKFNLLTRNVLNLQHEYGGFSWQLSALKDHCDTSATAMILSSIVRAYSAEGISAEMKEMYENEFLPEIRKGYDYICGYVSDGKVFDCEAECLGFGMYPQVYGSYPWSLGSALYLGALL